MGSSQADKAASHQRIVEAASRRIRRDGVDNVGVAELMSQAGLTHGGFYRHFDSRDELMAEAIAEALEQGAERFRTSAAPGGHGSLSAIIDGYLSRFHRDKPETGCAVAALPGDIARADPRCREAYARQVRSYIAVLTELIPAGDADNAQLILAALIGGLVLARAVGDRALSDEILDRVARALRRYVDPVEEI